MSKRLGPYASVAPIRGRRNQPYKHIYKTLIQSKLDYAALVLNSLSNTNNDKVNSIQHKALKIALAGLQLNTRPLTLFIIF